ncbi:unnamed protein product [Fasciola hepatica]|uniref:Cysteine-rich DPF motif domain-containing protein 1 n=1 Tax=Fasciola hepatica TaxID=6192 RepID=A0ABC9HHZ1_FASHE
MAGLWSRSGLNRLCEIRDILHLFLSHTQGRLKSDVVAATKGCQQQICEPEWFSPLSSRKNRVEVSESQSRCFVSRMSSVNTQFFCCSICDFRIPYDTKGRGSKYLSKEVQILEDAYIMRDPFADNNLGGIILGADCCLCKRMVCVSQKIPPEIVGFHSCSPSPRTASQFQRTANIHSCYLFYRI